MILYKYAKDVKKAYFMLNVGLPARRHFRLFSISKIEEDLLLPLYARFIRANRQVMRKPSIFCSLPFLFWERNQATEQQIIMAKLKNTKNTTTCTLPRLLSTITTETRCQEVKEHPARESQRRQTELQEWDVPFKGENQ